MCIRTFFVTTSFLLTMKVSIIVPVFRTERTLTRCVESLQAQTFTQWELILVDDGSDDVHQPYVTAWQPPMRAFALFTKSMLD